MLVPPIIFSLVVPPEESEPLSGTIILLPLPLLLPLLLPDLPFGLVILDVVPVEGSMSLPLLSLIIAPLSFESLSSIIDGLS